MLRQVAVESDQFVKFGVCLAISSLTFGLQLLQTECMFAALQAHRYGLRLPVLSYLWELS